jgi:hypothetical protein
VTPIIAPATAARKIGRRVVCDVRVSLVRGMGRRGFGVVEAGWLDHQSCSLAMPVSC